MLWEHEHQRWDAPWYIKARSVAFELRYYWHTCWCSHTLVTRDRDTKVNRDMVRQNMLHPIDQWKSGMFLLFVSIFLELINFPVQLGCYGYGSHSKVHCYWNGICFASLRAFKYRDTSHILRSCSHNITKINIQFLIETKKSRLTSRSQAKTAIKLCRYSSSHMQISYQICTN